MITRTYFALFWQCKGIFVKDSVLPDTKHSWEFVWSFLWHSYWNYVYIAPLLLYFLSPHHLLDLVLDLRIDIFYLECRKYYLTKKIVRTEIYYMSI